MFLCPTSEHCALYFIFLALFIVPFSWVNSWTLYSISLLLLITWLYHYCSIMLQHNIQLSSPYIYWTIVHRYLRTVVLTNSQFDYKYRTLLVSCTTCHAIILQIFRCIVWFFWLFRSRWCWPRFFATKYETKFITKSRLILLQILD